jgi:prepilin-type N-terminal cleavage/methylation domain-containing protein
MNLEKIKKAFTLIELLVWISVMSIIILWVTSIDYNRLSQDQKLDIFTNDVKSNFERIRNNSLAWKWIWLSLDIPTKWTIDYTKTSSWIIISKSFNWAVGTVYEDLNFQNNIYVETIRCLELDWTEDTILSTTGTWTIIFEWDKISLDTYLECDEQVSKILEISLTNKLKTKVIQINTLNWLVEIK